jgi:hypothetical protein
LVTIGWIPGAKHLNSASVGGLSVGVREDVELENVEAAVLHLVERIGF